ncbi:MAG TPA: LamG-like jellyroll fold domain-containing protein [Xanthomonadales bacterium]|nr:LamG-like jellyroll fold domain-containing protein [Xanthomonadales bacterium]
MRSFLRAAAAALVGLLFSSTAAAVLRADYQFQNSLASSVAGAPALTTIGTTAFATESVDGAARTVLTFTAGSGVALTPTTGVVPTSTTYSIVMLVRLATVAGYRKYVDFKNATSDNGLYANDGELEFYPTVASTTTPLADNTYARVVMTRDAAGNVAGYVDGVQVFAFVDTALDGVIDASNTLRFFVDDTVTTGEETAGAVSRISIYDNALTPGEVAGLFAGPQSVPALSRDMLVLLAVLVMALALVALRRG